jgi:hypothetical protein
MVGLEEEPKGERAKFEAFLRFFYQTNIYFFKLAFFYQTNIYFFNYFMLLFYGKQFARVGRISGWSRYNMAQKI